MKNCFKTVLAAVAVLVWLGASAQDDPSKETVIINPFTHTSAVSQAACDNIRAAVLSGFADRGRFHIVDALTDGTLSKLYADRNVEDVVNDANWKSESEAAYKALGCQEGRHRTGQQRFVLAVQVGYRRQDVQQGRGDLFAEGI